MALRHGGDALAEALRAEGVDVVFTLCGNHTLTAYQGLADAGLELVDARTEAGAVMAADAYARVQRRVAVALVTGGPGHTNALTGLATAHASHSPVLLLSGQTDLRLQGKGAQQELDQVGAARAMCKSARVVEDVDELATMVRESCALARTGTTGAVHLSIPSDVLSAKPTASPRPTAPALAQTTSRVDPAAVREVARRIRRAARPAVIAGAGAYLAHADRALERLTRATSLPLFTIDLARGIVDDFVEGVMGYADASISQRANELASADVVLLLGKDLDFRLRFGDAFAPDADLIDVRAPGGELDANRTRELAYEGDIAQFVEDLADVLSEDSPPEEHVAWRDLVASVPTVEDAESPEDPPFHPLDVARTLRSALPDDAALVLDAGDFVQWCRVELPARGPGRWIRLGPMSTCGAGTPFAMGVKKATPERPVVLVTGDGSFGYYLIEFEAALRQSLPFVAIVGHNDAWGLEYNLQQGLYGPDYTLASQLSPTRFDRVVEALGGYGERVTSLAELPAALDRALASGVPSCLEVPVSTAPSPLTKAVIARGGEV